MQKITFFFSLALSFSVCNSLDAQNWRLFFEKTQLDKYRSANEALGPPATGVDRVVFMGNSITESWPKMRPSFFEKPGYIGRGISGQTTSQMILRFRTDVISLEPKVMVMLAGINDIAENAGPIPIEIIAENIMTMSELADYHGIKVIICSVIPAIDFPWSPGMKPAGKVVTLNTLLKDYANKKGFPYVDYHSAMKDENNGLKVPDYTSATDLVHPNEAGYMVMEKMVQPEIEKALGAAQGSIGSSLKKFKFKRKKVLLEFADIAKVPNIKTLSKIEIAGANKQFVPAQTKVNGKKIKVWNAAVDKPKYVRFGEEIFPMK